MRTKQILLGTMLAFLLSFSFPLLFRAQTSTTPAKHITAANFPLIDSLVQSYARLGQFNGTLLVATQDGIVYNKGVGYAHFEWDQPMTTDAKFRIASLTKQFVAMLILQLAEEGKIDLQAPVTTYLKGLPEEAGKKITIHRLLNHTAGVPESSGRSSSSRGGNRNAYDTDEMIKGFSALTLAFEPGTKFSYSNPGYTLLGLVIEKVTGKPWEESLNEKILNPLGMHNSGYDRTSSVLKHRTSGYFKDPFGGYKMLGSQDMASGYTPGGMYSTTGDLYLWDRALYTDKLLSAKYRDLFFTPEPVMGWKAFGLGESPARYAYGWFISRLPPQTPAQKDSLTVQFHTGTVNGYNALLVRIPSERQSIIILNNTAVGREKLAEMATGIINILNGKPYANPKQDAEEFLIKTIRERGTALAAKDYSLLKTTHPDTYAFNSEKLELIADKLREKRQPADALDVYRVLVEIFPDYEDVFAVHATIGDLLVQLGKKDEACKAYQKSNSLNPAISAGEKDLLNRNNAKIEKLK